MCGIVGYLGQQQASLTLVDGLRRLEYRGYDSSGIAVVDSSQQLGLCRSTGKISNLEATLIKNPVQGTVGIGHNPLGNTWCTFRR